MVRVSISLNYSRKVCLIFIKMCVLAPTITDMITKETYQRTHAANLKPDNVDISRHPVHVGYVVLYMFSSSIAAIFQLQIIETDENLSLTI